MIFFSGDEHFNHHNIIKYCNRPYKHVDDMNHDLIAKNNEVVTDKDRVIHCGDFTLANRSFAEHIIKQLNGQHTFLLGSHDYWLDKHALQIWEKSIEGQHIVACHYAMRVWPRSHYNSWQVYGHSHGSLPSQGKQWDVGVDNNGFYPVSFEKLKEIMAKLDDNFNLVNKRY